MAETGKLQGSGPQGGMVKGDKVKWLCLGYILYSALTKPGESDASGLAAALSQKTPFLLTSWTGLTAEE